MLSVSPCRKLIIVLLWEFMLSLSDNNQADVVEEFNSTSKYLDDLLYIDSPYFELMVQIESENNQEIPQSQTADNTMALRGRAPEPS